ncbi:MAG: hypothetical protein JWO09_2039 [Bacteroidetes bacterium]|nr:hypothetical protein [Bacteroidota bacterium]
MKKIYVFLICCLSYANANSQSYVQGDINVMPQPMMTHDSTTCTSNCNLMYSIMISNSFMGDSVKIKDQSSGSVIVYDVNMSGANPWYVYLPVPVYNSFVGDNELMGGNASFFGPTVKVISGPDTIYNINNYYILPVSNPCNYGTVSGRIYVDHNNDCSFNTGDVALSSIPVEWSANLNSPSMTYSFGSGFYSDGSGMYTAQVLESWMLDYSVNIPSNYQFIFPSTTCSPASYLFTTLPQVNADFSLQCSSSVDVQCYAGSSGVIRPNVPFSMFPSVSNTGCDSASGQLRLVLDSRVTYNAALSSSPAPSVSGDTLTWNYSGLTNLTSGGYWNSFFANINLTPDPTVISGDMLCFHVFTNVPAADVNPANNDYSFCLPVVSSYDPNFKEVSPAGTTAAGLIDPISDTVLTYTIHFQNTGTAPAMTVSVTDSLDADLIPSSLQILGSSHNVTPVWSAPNVVSFTFYGINLPDSTSNEAASHGSVTFRIKRQPSLAAGTQIRNKAEIYFDFNPAVVTNTTLNTIQGPAGITDIVNNGSVSVYPNPFSDNTTFMINTDKSGEVYSFELSDVLGKSVKSMKTTDRQFSVSREGLQNGMYFYSITTADGLVGIGKVIIK